MFFQLERCSRMCTDWKKTTEKESCESYLYFSQQFYRLQVTWARILF